jgi:hypothetical protein
MDFLHILRSSKKTIIASTASVKADTLKLIAEMKLQSPLKKKRE